MTDADGNIAQHIEYIPYGEVFVEERNSQFSTNFLFNAKELDNETGLYYYGARYLDPTGGMWLSVDPMWEKYTDANPYNYCHGNPITMVDPDGRNDYEVNPQGYIKEVPSEVQKSEIHTLYAVDKDGKRTGSKINVNNKSILDNLTKNRSDYEGHYSLSKSSEVLPIFSFLADASSDAEWGMMKFSDNSYSIYTSHIVDKVDRYFGKKNEFDIKFNIHSHPGFGFEGSKGASGWYGPNQLSGDMANISDFFKRWTKKYGETSPKIQSFPKHFVYHRLSKHVYQFTPWEWSIDLGKVNNHGLNNNLRKAKSPLSPY